MPSVSCEKVKNGLWTQGWCSEAKLSGVWSADVSRGSADGPPRDARLRSQLALPRTSHGRAAGPSSEPCYHARIYALGLVLLKSALSKRAECLY